MTAMALPAGPDLITPEWLTTALRERGYIADASVTSVETEPIGQGVGLLCQLARLTPVYDRDEPSAPRSMVVKLPTHDPQTRAMVNIFRFYEREVRFYRELAPEIGLKTAACYYGEVDGTTGDFALLLEDLATARLGDQLHGCAIDDAKLAIRELAAMHASWWNSPRLDTLAWMPESSDPINKAGVSLYPRAWPLFMVRIGDKLPAQMTAIGEKLGTQITGILDRFVEGPRTLCHGDYRLDNLFFQTTSAPAPLSVIDWQIAIKGVGTYDIGYFMSQSMDIEVRRKHEQDILKMYHELLCEGGVTGYTFDQLLSDYRWTLLFCFAYPVMGGGMGDLSNERGYALATTMMNRSAAAILDWNAGDLLNS